MNQSDELLLIFVSAEHFHLVNESLSYMKRKVPYGFNQ